MTAGDASRTSSPATRGFRRNGQGQPPLRQRRPLDRQDRSPRRDLPERFGPWGSVWKRFDRWSKEGVWRRVFEALQDPDLEWMIIDCTVVRAHPACGREKRGQGAEAVIPTKKNRNVPRDYGNHLYKERNKVEWLISLIKQYRRVATRYEKTARNFVGFVHVASVMVLLW